MREESDGIVAFYWRRRLLRGGSGGWDGFFACLLFGGFGGCTEGGLAGFDAVEAISVAVVEGGLAALGGEGFAVEDEGFDLGGGLED